MTKSMHLVTTYTFSSLINMPFNFMMAFSAASRVSKCTYPKPLDPFSSQHTLMKRNLLQILLRWIFISYKSWRWRTLGYLLYRTRCFQMMRRCQTGPRCQWISAGSWWRRFPRHSSSGKGFADTTLDALACPSWGQSSWYPRLVRLRCKEIQRYNEFLE